MKPHYRATEEQDILPVATNLRKADRDEVQAGSGLSPLEVLQVGVTTSHPCFTMVGQEGEPFGLFGVAPTSEPGTGNVWLLATPGLDTYGTRFARESRQALEDCFEKYDMLWNVVDARNEVHIRWLRWLGFAFIAKHPHYGREHRPFYEFVRIKSNV